MRVRIPCFQTHLEGISNNAVEPALCCKPTSQTLKSPVYYDDNRCNALCLYLIDQSVRQMVHDFHLPDKLFTCLDVIHTRDAITV